MDIDLSRHLSGFFHVHIEVEKVLQSRHGAKRFELVSERLRLSCGSASACSSLVRFGLRTHSCDALMSLDLLLGVEGCLSLIVPELPGRL